VSWTSFAAALPWLLQPVVTLWRLRDSRSLDQESPDVPADAPLVSVIVPARNEARSIARCVRSILASTYPALEVIVVDDRSEDDTGAIVREIARDDPHLRVIEAPPLPEGWFGKQWACAQGAEAARGSILCFTDADAVHAPELVSRSVNAMRARSLDLLSVAGRQELGSFWERVVQPHVFAMIAARYGGTNVVNRSHRAEDKIANGQCMFMTRAAHDDVGGHGAVRTKVAEDVALAQLFFRRGKHSEIVLGMEQLATRMYSSLGEVIRGWMKNIYAATVDAMPFGTLGRLLHPFALLATPLATLAPPVVLLAAAFITVPGSLVTWALVCTAVLLAWWATVYVGAQRLSPLYALTFPLGAAVVLYIIVRAMLRGRRVEWKGRSYQVG
jgi:hypothetical protein